MIDGFNPRPPKRTLCRVRDMNLKELYRVSIHVLRRGRCVLVVILAPSANSRFQSTSSEEDVVSSFSPADDLLDDVSIHVLRRGRCVTYSSGRTAVPIMFQSTSSEEDVVSVRRTFPCPPCRCFNPRPPKRTLCQELRQFSDPS